MGLLPESECGEEDEALFYVISKFKAFRRLITGMFSQKKYINLI